MHEGPLNLETDAIWVIAGKGEGCIVAVMRCQTVILYPVVFASKNFLSEEQWYSNIESEDLGILDCLEKFHH